MSMTIPQGVTLPQLVKLLDAHSAELIPSAGVYPQLVAQYGKRRAGLLWFAALAFITIRDDIEASGLTATEHFAPIAGLFCLVLTWPIDGWWAGALVGAAIALFTVSLIKTLFREIRDGWWLR